MHDGDVVALEGFTHLIPHAAGHELVRQGRRDLTLIRMTPDIVYDQMIGMGSPEAGLLLGRQPGRRLAAPLPRRRRARLADALEIEEHSHAGMATAYAAGAANLPFGVLRGYRGTDLVPRTRVADITCPFTGEVLAAVPALRPDVSIVHAQQADRRGNVQLWGITGVQKEAALAARRTLVTVEEIVDELDPRPGAVVLPGWVLAVSEAPGGPTRPTPTATTSVTTPSTGSGTSQPRPRHVHRLDAAPRARHRRHPRVPPEPRAGRGGGRLMERADDGQPPYDSPDYRSSRLRAPGRPLLLLPHTLSELTGPVFGEGDVDRADADLTRQHAGEPLGERIIVHGRVLDADGRPSAHAGRDLAGQRRRPLPRTRSTSTPRRSTRTSPAPAAASPTTRAATASSTIKPGAYPWRQPPERLAAGPHPLLALRPRVRPRGW